MPARPTPTIVAMAAKGDIVYLANGTAYRIGALIGQGYREITLADTKPTESNPKAKLAVSITSPDFHLTAPTKKAVSSIVH